MKNGRRDMVPLAPFVPLMREYIEQNNYISKADGTKEGGLNQMALALKLDEGRVRQLLGEKPLVDRKGKESFQTEITFDTADRIICATDNFLLWYTDPAFSKIYQETDISQPSVKQQKPKRRCAIRGCSKTFEIKPRARHQRFCSSACRARDQRHRRNERNGNVSGRFGTRHGACPNGHDRSPENTRERKDGSIVCLACGREKEKAKYANNPEHAERRRQQAREYRARKKAA